MVVGEPPFNYIELCALQATKVGGDGLNSTLLMVMWSFGVVVGCGDGIVGMVWW